MNILGIETSCDETAAAVVTDGRNIRSNVVSSQVDLHARYGGVVPEIAGRAHESLITPVVELALQQAELSAKEIDAVAATYGPGLIGSLLIGVSAAKALAMVWDVPFIGINHHEAHLYAALLDQQPAASQPITEQPAASPPAASQPDPSQPDPVEFPLLVLLVSGGHTMLIEFIDHGKYRLLGATLDDAAGEAFDKVARYLGLGYPGGPAIDNLSTQGDPTAVPLPRALMNDSFDFSFSGLKTAVINHVRKNPAVSTPDMAASFQASVVDVLIKKSIRAAIEVGASGICLAGGVAANRALRERLTQACAAEGLTAHLPSRSMCTDNAAMVAATAWWRLAQDGPHGFDLGADPSLKLDFIS